MKVSQRENLMDFKLSSRWEGSPWIQVKFKSLLKRTCILKSIEKIKDTFLFLFLWFQHYNIIITVQNIPLHSQLIRKEVMLKNEMYTNNNSVYLGV